MHNKSTFPHTELSSATLMELVMVSLLSLLILGVGLDFRLHLVHSNFVYLVILCSMLHGTLDIELFSFSLNYEMLSCSYNFLDFHAVEHQIV